MSDWELDERRTEILRLSNLVALFLRYLPHEAQMDIRKEVAKVLAIRWDEELAASAGAE
jgi:hypothetical protein